MRLHNHTARHASLAPLLLVAAFLWPQVAAAQVAPACVPDAADGAAASDPARDYMGTIPQPDTPEQNEPPLATSSPIPECPEENQPSPVTRSPLGPIDGGVLTEVIRDRLDDVARQALTNALKKLLGRNGDDASAPLWLTDLFGTIDLLIRRDEDEALQSERLGLGIMRLSTVAALSAAFCANSNALDCVDVVYSGAQQSRLGAHLAFAGAVSTGHQAPASATTLTAAVVAQWIDDILRFDGLTDAGAALVAVRSACVDAPACADAPDASFACLPARVVADLQTWPEQPTFADVEAFAGVARDWRAGVWASDSTVTGRPTRDCARALETLGATADAPAWSADEESNDPFSELLARASAAETMLRVQSRALLPLVAVLRPLVAGDASAARDAWLPFVTAGVQQLVDALVERAGGLAERKPAKRVARALGHVAAQIPAALRLTDTSTLGIELDVDALTVELLESVTATRDGFGFRASIGFGYLSVLSVPDGSDGNNLLVLDEHRMVALPYEEIGLLYRQQINGLPVRIGGHVTVSGALMQLVDTGDLRNPVLVGVGTHATFYDAIDISLTSGFMRTGIEGRSARTHGGYLVFGVQLPLVDYLRRL